MIIITGSMRMQAGRRKDAIALGCEHSARSRSEPGCLAHNCYVDAEDSSVLHFFEKWQDVQAVKAHFTVAGSRYFMQQMSAMSETAPQIEIFNSEQLDIAAL